jgi:hypothetical protein
MRINEASHRESAWQGLPRTGSEDNVLALRTVEELTVEGPRHHPLRLAPGQIV